MYILRGKVFKTRSTTPPSFCKTGKRRAVSTNANSKTRSLNAMKTSAKNNFNVMTYHDARTQAGTPFGDLRGHTTQVSHGQTLSVVGTKAANTRDTARRRVPRVYQQ
eukprot:scaffold54971_cov47-Attheya_sp.AAC.4